MTKWKVEIRTTCKICGKPLPNARFRTYCSAKCRNKRNNDKQNKDGYGTNWQRDRRSKIASVPEPDKTQCYICSGWYKNVKQHITQSHKLNK